MRARKEERKAINRARRKHGKKNGVLGAWAFDYGPRPNPETDKRAKRPRYRRSALGE